MLRSVEFCGVFMNVHHWITTCSLGGFDEWRLHFFTDTCTNRYLEFHDRVILHAAVQAAIKVPPSQGARNAHPNPSHCQ